MANPESSRPNHLSPNPLSNLRLKKVLKSYQQCAPDSLNGPNYYHPTWINGDHHHQQHLHPRGIKYPGEKYANNSNSIGASTYTTSSSRAHSTNLTNNNHHHKVISNNSTTTTATTTTTTNHNNHNNSNNLSHSNKANNINLSDNHHNNSSNHSNHTNNTSPDLLVSSPTGGSSSSSSSSSVVNIQCVSTCSTLGSKNELNPSSKSLNSDGASKSSSNSNQISISSSNSSNGKISGGREKGGGGGSSTSSSSKTELSSTTTSATSSVTKSSSLSSSSSSTPTATTFSNQVALPPPNIRIPPPIIIPADPDSCQRSETILEGEVISCFIVGGEKRLCLPQVFNSVLTAFTLQQINSVCGELHIFCSRCTPEQLEVLKVTGIIPAAAPSCGLITKTDAERLCAALLFYANRDKMLMMAGTPGVNLTPFAGPPPMMGLDYDDLPFDTKGLPIGGGDSLLTLKTEKLSTGLPVSHKCFGQCSGTLYPDLYTESTSRCIKCSICGIWLTPQRFVTHIHASTENHTCHWGFDSYNWRAYIHLDDESKEYQCAIDVEQLEAELDSFKSRFDPTVNNTGSGLCNNPNVNSPAANKRKLNQSNKIETEKRDDYDKQSNNLGDDQLLEPLKKIKTEDMAMMKLSPPSAVAAFLTSPYPPPYLPPPPPPSLLPPPNSVSSLHHSYHHFPVSTNWTPDPSVFSYWYQHPNLSLSSSTTAPSTSPSPSPSSGSSSSSSTIPSSTPTLSQSTSTACTTSTAITTTANHNHPNSSSPDKNRQGLAHHHLLSNMDKLLRTNKVHSDLRVQIFKEIESIIEKVRSTGNDSNVVVDTTPS